MAFIVNELLADLGINGQTLTTFPELFIWLCKAVFAVSILNTVIQSLFYFCFRVGKRG